MTKSIVITSGKGGVGKTTLTANLGRMLSSLGARVLLIDTDMGLNNLDVTMNIEKKVIFDIVDVISGKCRLKQAIIEDECRNVFILPSAHSYDTSNVTSESLRSLIDGLVGFDFCLVDCPAGIEIGFHRAVSACDEAIVVTTPHISALKDADKVISILRSYKIRPSLVLNRVRGDLILSGDMIAPEEVREALNANLIGVIPENDEVGICTNTGFLLDKSNESYKAIEMLAKNIINNEQKLFDATKQFRGIIGKIKMAIRRNK